MTGDIPKSIKDIYPTEKLPTNKINYLRHYGETAKMIEEVLVPAYRQWMPKKYYHKQGWERTYNKQEKVLRFYRDGEIFIGHISFWTYDQKVEDTQGATLKAINYDEVPPLGHFNEGIWRMTTGRVWIGIYATPTEGPNWIFDLLENEKQRDKVESFEVSTLTNPYVNLESVDQALQTLSYDEKLVRLLGQHRSLAGFIYSGPCRLRSDIHIIDPFEIDYTKYLVVRGLDPHPSKETCCVEVAIDRLGTIFVIGSYFENADSEQVKRDLWSRIIQNKWRLGWTCYDKSLDYEAKGYDNINIIDKYKRPPNAIPAMFASEKYKGSIDAGIDQIKEYLKLNKQGKPKIYFFNTPEVKRVIRDIQTLERDSGRNEDKRGKRDKVLEGSKDFHACLRYIFQRPLEWIAPDDIVADYETNYAQDRYV
jgi:phage terminase large subunit-like protein